MRTVMWEVYQSYVYKNDKTVGTTVDHTGLQDPPGSSLHWSIAQIVVLWLRQKVVYL